MKKLLIATTALTAFAGAAYAEVSLSGKAQAGIHGPTDDLDVYSSIDLDITMSGTSDNGIEFGATMDINAGDKFDTADFEDDDPEGGTAGLGSVYISGDLGKLSFDHDGIDDLYDDDYGGHDVKYEGTFGGLSVNITGDVNDSSSDSAYSANFGYSIAGLALDVDYSNLNDGAFDVDAAYTIADAITVGVNYDDSGEGDAVLKGRASYEANGLMAKVEVADNDDYDVTLSYAAGAWSFGATVDEESDFEVTVDYDMGGGLSFESGYQSSSEVIFAGVAMAF